MELDFEKLTQKLSDLDKMADGLDGLLKDLRVEIHDILWDLIELKKEKVEKRENETVNKEKLFDVAIIGAGPAGLIAAHELQDKSIVVTEKGAPIPKRVCPMVTECVGCNRCGEIEGIGGAGGWSDGKLCLGPVGILDQFLGEHYPDEIQAINRIFREVLQEKYVEPNDCVDTCQLGDALTQEITEVANLGTSTIRYAFQHMSEGIRSSGSTLIANDRVVQVSDDYKHVFTVKTKSGREFHARNVIVATGKCDFTLVPQLIERYTLKTIPTEPTLGFRLAIPNEELQKMKSFGNNPKLKLHLPNRDTVKTHCFAFGGEVMAYVCGNYFLVGGRADYQNPTQFANTNILYKFSSEDPKERKEMVHTTLASIKADYPRNVIYQDLPSFFDPSRKPQETNVPACRGGKLGNLLPYYPPYVVEAMREFIYNMANAYEMDMSKATIFGPAAEWLNDAVAASMEMETAKKGLYIVGDGAGITQGIMAAAVTGYRAAHSIRGKSNA